jgi:hypothetical protein
MIIVLLLILSSLVMYIYVQFAIPLLPLILLGALGFIAGYISCFYKNNNHRRKGT